MSNFSHCVECNRRLRNAFFCPRCGEPACSWPCLDRHRDRHPVLRLPPLAAANGRGAPRARR